MIIESGNDVVQVLVGSVGDDTPRGLWMIGMDENLRLNLIQPIVAEMPDGVERRVVEIASVLDDEPSVAYFALAWATDELIDRESSWVAELDQRLAEHPDLRAARLLGIIVFDPSAVFSSVTRCDFSLEPRFADLPRALPIAGPHGFECRCPLCVADRRLFDDDRYGDDEYLDGYGYGEGFDAYAGGSSGGGRGRSRYRAPYDDYRGEYREGEPQYDPIWKRWYPQPARAFQRWTFDEEVALARSHFAGLSVFDISILMSRQPGAIARRLNSLGISSRTLVGAEPAAASSSPASPGPASPGPASPGPASPGPASTDPPPPAR